jgi:DNA-binding NtrC family response regulator
MLTDDGYQVVSVGSGEAALELAADQKFDLAVVDLSMKGIGGMEVLAALRRQSPGTALIMLTAHASPEVAGEALRQGAHDFLTKPCHPAQLRESVRTGLVARQRELRQREWLAQLERNPADDVESIRATVVERLASPT